MAEIVVALDLPTAADARRLASGLPSGAWVKIGPTLFIESGASLVREFKDRGFRVFLDLKWHDIPHQVEGAAAAAARLGVDLATVHTLGGVEMMRAAAGAAGAMRVVGVTVLTSHTSDSFGDAVGRSHPDVPKEVARLSALAARAGLAGVVASPLEIETVRSVLGGSQLIVVPGIRPPGAEKGDQQRTADASVAARAGATHLVVGRPITQAAEPAAVYQRLCESIA